MVLATLWVVRGALLVALIALLAQMRQDGLIQLSLRRMGH